MLPKICVIIPCRGGEDTLEKCVRSVLAADYPSREIAVVDDGLDSFVRGKLRAYGDDLVVLEGQLRGPSYGRNLAAGWTDAEYIVFTDSDCIVPKDWLRELVRGMQTSADAVSCGGRQELPDDASVFERRVFAFMRRTGMLTEYVRTTKGTDIIAVEHNPSCNVLYKRDVYLKQGGFLQGLWPGEDVEFDYRLRKLGHMIVFNPKSVVFHYKPKTLQFFCRMMYRYGMAQGALVRRYGIFRAVQWVPVMSLGALALFFLQPAVALLILAACCLAAGLLMRSAWFVVLAVYTAAVWNAGFIAGIAKRFPGPSP